MQTPFLPLLDSTDALFHNSSGLIYMAMMLTKNEYRTPNDDTIQYVSTLNMVNYYICDLSFQEHESS